MLAGRKLLLADDSVTIQKVIDLTFADEGVRVIAFSNGQDAIEHLEEVAPDIVLADVFMPLKSGYEVCEYVKKSEKLKHIPVMLLVGSFEPFDEAEARRVGADDILTKPFQSIRRLIDKVGALVGGSPGDQEVPTAELTKTDDKPAQEEEVGLNTLELDIVTADTMPLPQDAQDSQGDAENSEILASATQPVPSEEHMATSVADLSHDAGPGSSEGELSDSLLDLGDFEPAHTAGVNDFVLDLDDTLDGETSAPLVDGRAPIHALIEPQVAETEANIGDSAFSYHPEIQNASTIRTEELAYEDQVHDVVVEPEKRHESLEQSAPIAVEREGAVVETPAPASSNVLAADKLSPEMIEAIARRAVEMLSEKVIQDIAWEVVPDLAELLIKRQLEEKESQAK